MKIINYVGMNKKVLDVGCASGYLAERLKKNECYVVGIEIDEAATKTAKQFCDNIIVGDVEQLNELPYPSKFFDVIVYSDILEHLKRPDLVLIKFKKYLAPKGCVIASIPNVARFEVRLKLLLGKFDYTDTGHLDVTHLRFFTIKTAKQLLESTGYKVEKVDYTGLASRISVLKLFPTLFANQIILIAKSIESETQ